MSSECDEYKRRKSGSNRREEADTEQWDRFIGVAISGTSVILACLSPLRSVSRSWGQDKIQHYQWAHRGIKFCNSLRAAANEIPDWNEAVIKLNRLLVRRSELSRRRPFRKSVSLIDQVDLVGLKAWTHKDSFIKDKDPEGLSLPYETLTVDNLTIGFGFDKYGLIARNEFAVRTEPLISKGVEQAEVIVEETNLPNSLNADIDESLDILKVKTHAGPETRERIDTLVNLYGAIKESKLILLGQNRMRG
jgi:hypothetical protein